MGGKPVGQQQEVDFRQVVFPHMWSDGYGFGEAMNPGPQQMIQEVSAQLDDRMELMEGLEPPVRPNKVKSLTARGGKMYRSKRVESSAYERGAVGGAIIPCPFFWERQVAHHCGMHVLEQFMQWAGLCAHGPS